MPVGATIGAALIGAGGSIAAGAIGADAQSDAAEAGVAAQERIAGQQLAVQLPFLQRGYQAQSALAMQLGLPENPNIGGAPFDTLLTAGGGVPGERVFDYEAYVRSQPDIFSEFSRIANGGFGPNLPAGYDDDGDGELSITEYGRFHFDEFGRDEGRQLPLTGGGGFLNADGSITDADGNAVEGGSAASSFGQAYNPEEAFRNSLFFRAGDIAFEEDQDRLDANAAARGSFFSGANALARETARERNYGNALRGYNAALGSLFGAGTNAANASQDALGDLGVAQQNAAFQQGQAAAGFWGGVGNTIGGLGGLGAGYGFSQIGGAPASPAAFSGGSPAYNDANWNWTSWGL